MAAISPTCLSVIYSLYGFFRSSTFIENVFKFSALTIEWKKSLCDSKLSKKKEIFFSYSTNDYYTTTPVMALINLRWWLFLLSFFTVQLLPLTLFNIPFLLFITKNSKKKLKINNKFQVNLYVSLCCAAFFSSQVLGGKSVYKKNYLLPIIPLRVFLEFMSLMRGLEWCLFGLGKNVTIIYTMVEREEKKYVVEDRLLCIEWVVVCFIDASQQQQQHNILDSDKWILWNR